MGIDLVLAKVKPVIYLAGFAFGGLFILGGVVSDHVPSLLVSLCLVGAWVLPWRLDLKALAGSFALVVASIVIIMTAPRPIPEQAAPIVEPAKESPKRGLQITPAPTATTAPLPTATTISTIAPTDTAMALPHPTTTSTLQDACAVTRVPTKAVAAKPTSTSLPIVLPTSTPMPVTAIPTYTLAPISGGHVCPGGSACIKGNINSAGERIYHFLGCASYNRTKIDTGQGERWFTSSAEAEAASWRRAQYCPK